MKKPILILIALLLGTFTSYTASNTATRPFTYDGSAYIFIEGPVEFSVFPDGQFDFVYLGYDDRGRVNVNINTANVKSAIPNLIQPPDICLWHTRGEQCVDTRLRGSVRGGAAIG